MSPKKQQLMDRAELVRNRRAEKLGTRQKRALESYHRPATFNTPVTSRTGVAGMPIHQKARSRVKKAYYYTLSTPGAEVRLPAMPSIQIGWRLLSGILAILIFAAIYTMWKLPFFQVSTPEVTGLQRIPAEELLATAGVEGLSILEVDPNLLTADLTHSFPEIATIQVRIGFPASVLIDLTERVPVIAWTQNEKTIWIDQYGYAFPPRGEVEGLIQVISGFAPPAPPQALLATTTQTATSESASAALPAFLAEPSAPQVIMDPRLIPMLTVLSQKVPQGTRLTFHERYGYGWQDPRGWKVFFGNNLEQIDLKLQQYEVLIKQLTKEEIKPKLISLEYINAPYYREEN